MQPSTSTTTTTTAVAFRKAHPIRGILWGLLMGLGATVIAILLKIIPLDLLWAVVVLVAGIVLGTLWSTLGPARKPKGEPPWRTEQVTHRADWDATVPPEPPGQYRGPIPPSPPAPPESPTRPDVEPLHIRPLDVEPLDLDPQATPDVPAETASDTMPEPAEPVVETFPEAPRTVDPPDRPPPPPPPG